MEDLMQKNSASENDLAVTVETVETYKKGSDSFLELPLATPGD